MQRECFVLHEPLNIGESNSAHREAQGSPRHDTTKPVVEQPVFVDLLDTVAA